jgi:hypothetical protein
MKKFIILIFIGIFCSMIFADCVWVAHTCRSECCGQQGGMYIEDGINDMSQALALEKQGRAVIFNKGTQPGGEDICIAYAESPNLNPSTLHSCISDCQINAGCGTGSSSATSTVSPLCDNQMGEIIAVQGTAYCTRSGTKELIIVGNPFCEGDIIETGDAVGTKVIIRFSDGNIRYVIRRSHYTINAYEPEKYYEGIEGAMHAIFDGPNPASELETIVGGITLPRSKAQQTAPRSGYRIHSSVLFEIDDSVNRVTVLEGEVEILDLNTGNVIGLIQASEQYSVASYADPATGTIYQIDLADYTEEIARGEEMKSYSGGGCCMAFILFLPLTALLSIYHINKKT